VADRNVSQSDSSEFPRGTRSRHHHGSHRQLLSERPAVHFPADVDAIIVPAARHVATLRSAVTLAGKLRATLVALCSKWSSASEVAALVEDKGVKLIAIDVDELPAGVIPSFATCRTLAGTRFERRTDTSLKRNLGLLLARLIGWERVVFLDDDIEIPEPMDLREAVGLTDRYAGVGLAIDGMPDNSVVCHAFRCAGGEQDVFIGGGALAIGARSMTSFFPNIYNEDWFFLLDDNGLRSATTVGTAVQMSYDPFWEQRARSEELGDCLAEGMFWLLDSGRSLSDAGAGHWRTFLRERVNFITEVMGMVERMGGDPAQRNRMLLSLKAARGRCQLIDPALCVRYLHAWRADRFMWRRHVDDLCRTLVARKAKPERRSLAGVREMLRSLALPDRSAHLRVPHERFHHHPADFHVAFPVVVR
jgi:glycosyltransferase involved in cell wall biosynthesis